MITNRCALHKITYGMYIVSSHKNGKPNGQIANTVFQLTSKPAKIGISINKENLTHEFIKNSGVFGVSILTENTPFKLIGLFGFRSGRDVNKFESINYTTGKTGAPIVTDYTAAYIEAEVSQEIDVGSHTLFIGNVIDADILTDKNLMSYEYYHKVLRGRTPEKAATFLEVKK